MYIFLLRSGEQRLYYFSSSVAQHSNGLRWPLCQVLEKLKFDGTILIDGDDGISPTKAIKKRT